VALSVGFFPTNQKLLNTFLIALIGWIKAVLTKKPLLFCTCKQAHSGVYRKGRTFLLEKRPLFGKVFIL